MNDLWMNAWCAQRGPGLQQQQQQRRQQRQRQQQQQQQKSTNSSRKAPAPAISVEWLRQRHKQNTFAAQIHTWKLLHYRAHSAAMPQVGTTAAAAAAHPLVAT
jgi:hypothetical protein